jgi:hypothetical protein
MQRAPVVALLKAAYVGATVALTQHQIFKYGAYSKSSVVCVRL